MIKNGSIVLCQLKSKEYFRADVLNVYPARDFIIDGFTQDDVRRYLVRCEDGTLLHLRRKQIKRIIPS